MAPLVIFFLFLLAHSQASYSLPGFNSCQTFPSRSKGVPQRPFDHELHFIIGDTVDIHEAALVLQRLMCVLREHFRPPSNTGFLIGAPHSWHYTFCCRSGRDVYELFVLMLKKSRTPRKDLCSLGRFRRGKFLIFTDVEGIHCPDDLDHETFNIVLDRWHKYYGREKATNRYYIDVKEPESFRSIYDLAFRIGNVPFNSSLVVVKEVRMKRLDDSDDDKKADVSNHMFIGLIYVLGLLIAIFILFFSLLNLINVNEHYLYILHAIIRQRVRRQRARMAADNGENGEAEEEEGEEAVERPNRRNRLNSEERSLLGTDENTIRTALSGRFTSTLSFHSTDSRPRRNSLDSLEEVVVDPSDDVPVDEKEKKEKMNK